MRQIIFFIFVFAFSESIVAQNIPFEQNNNQTATYAEAMDFYKYLAKAHKKNVRVVAEGMTDSGEPLHTVVLANDKAFDPKTVRKQGKCVLFINNGIHPGESDGIDASMLFAKAVLQNKEVTALLNHVTVVIIPVYNIDGALNRNTSSRANQNGPEAYGFRGNGQNLDLNRDFVKCDTRNAQSFNKIFSTWLPDVFIDNHVSNGADYQYVMTLIPTEHSKLERPLAQYLDTQLLPELYKGMKAATWDMSPYVNSIDYETERPDTKGIAGFMDSPRYSTGYAALHHCIGFMPETHMLKPYSDRVRSTQALLHVMLSTLDRQYAAVLTAKAKAVDLSRNKTEFPIQWTLDESQKDSLLFKGFKAGFKPSEISGAPRLWYDRSQPFERYIPFFNTYKSALNITKPKAYILPQAWYRAAERLRNNGVQLIEIQRDTLINIERYEIKDYKTRDFAYEGHYLHSKLNVVTKKEKRLYRKGDFWITTNQDAVRYLIETLEPQAPDSYFSWNYFEGILMSKEGFSPYVFEDLAAQFLAQNPSILAELNALKQADAAFAKDGAAQLDWVYTHSPWYYDREAYNMYPVARVME
jgi:hypothetical protein